MSYKDVLKDYKVHKKCVLATNISEPSYHMLCEGKTQSINRVTRKTFEGKRVGAGGGSPDRVTFLYVRISVSKCVIKRGESSAQRVRVTSYGSAA